VGAHKKEDRKNWKRRNKIRNYVIEHNWKKRYICSYAV
jgi:hypothetical protein